MIDNKMRVCLLATEIFAWGKFGGFGRATRLIGSELLKRGWEVSAIVPRRNNQGKFETLDGIRVFGFDLRNITETLRIFRECKAEVYHSQEPSFSTYLAQKFHPDKKHVVTFRDTRLLSDWITEFRYPSINRIQVLSNWLYEDSFFVRKSVRKADARAAAAHLLIDRAKRKYRLVTLPVFLPTPVEIPEHIHKENHPTVCYIGRWDRRKRLELLIELVGGFPEVNFIVAGSSRDSEYDLELRNEFRKYSNVELPGFVNQFESDKLSDILSRSWIQVNTAAREGLPNSFIEGCAHKCALLSSVDPDGFTSKFGRCVASDKFEEGLNFLLEQNRWEELGERGYKYIREKFSLDVAIEKHIKLYQTVLEEN